VGRGKEGSGGEIRNIVTIRRRGAQRQKEGSEGRREKMRGDKMI